MLKTHEKNDGGKINMKIWDNEQQTFIQESSLDTINAGLTLGEKLLNIIKSTPLSNSYKNNLIKQDLLKEAMRQETVQKNQILETIIKLREMDRLSPDEFKLMMLAYSAVAKF